MTDTDKKKSTDYTLVFLGIILLLGFALLGGFMRAERNQQREDRLLEATLRETREDRLRAEREETLIDCNSNAYQTYLDSRNAECSGRWLEPGCFLPVYVEDSLREMYSESMDRCIKLYK